MRDETRVAEPLLVSGMRRHPTGDVRHVPAPPTGACGTSTAGFLRELDEWAAQIRAETLREVVDFLRNGNADWSPWVMAGNENFADAVSHHLTAPPAPTPDPAA